MHPSNRVMYHKAGSLLMLSPSIKRPKNTTDNYKPISLTSITYTMMGHIVLHYLNQYIDTMLFNWRHELRRSLSAETQLCGTLHDIMRHVDSVRTIHAAVLDFKKAFDKVPQALLINKLNNTKILNLQIISWIQNLLHEKIVGSCRRTRIKTIISTLWSPTGVCAGPTLFLIYINWLCKLQCQPVCQWHPGVLSSQQQWGWTTLLEEYWLTATMVISEENAIQHY